MLINATTTIAIYIYTIYYVAISCLASILYTSRMATTTIATTIAIYIYIPYTMWPFPQPGPAEGPLASAHPGPAEGQLAQAHSGSAEACQPFHCPQLGLQEAACLHGAKQP